MRHKWHGFDPWVGKIHWRRAWQPIPVFLPGGLQSIASQRVGYGWVTEEAWIVLVGAISKILWEQTRKETQRSLELAQKHRAWKEGVEGPTINQLSPSVSAFYFPFLVTPYLRNISHSFSKWDSVMQKTQWQCEWDFSLLGKAKCLCCFQLSSSKLISYSTRWVFVLSCSDSAEQANDREL